MKLTAAPRVGREPGCSHDPCACEPGDPAIATIGYAERRRHPDAGDLDAMRVVNAWLRDGIPQLHVRFSDGEFSSMLSSPRPFNCDGQPHLPDTLGVELVGTLASLAQDGHAGVLVGGDWRVPGETWGWLKERGIIDLIPWCPSQVFVNGIASGLTLEMLELVRSAPGKKYLVANRTVANAVHAALGARPMIVPDRNAYAAMPGLEEVMRTILCPGDVVLWAAGLGCKPALYRLFRDCQETTHLDVGCLFDGAAGVISRGWMNQDPATDERWRVYLETYVPWLTAK